MRDRWLVVAACLCAATYAAAALGQIPSGRPTAPTDQPVAGSWCSCGTHPPGPEPVWTSKPYANEPEDMRPYARFVKPYHLNYLQPTIWNGPGRNIPAPENILEVRIGFVGPISPQDPDYVSGLRMLHGAQLAIEQANARGGYGGRPFRLMPHDDYNNWQSNSVAGYARPTNSQIWGAASDIAVQCIYDDKDWAIFGSINSESTHIMLRVSLKAEIPIVNSASTDPTIPETSIPWYFTDIQDDRMQSYTLARHIYTEAGLRRVAILRINSRYGRMGVPKFRDASRRLGHPVVIEQKFMPGDTDFSRELANIRDSRVDAIVLWADDASTAMILRQMHAMGMKMRVFGSYRTLGPELLTQAGPAAEGFQAVFPYDPNRSDPRWLQFNTDFEARFHQRPEQFASLAYDAMNMLLDSICRAGLNRVRIQDALDGIREYNGVTGHMVFDPNAKNVAPMYIGTVHNGAITYQPASMSKPSATERVITAHARAIHIAPTHSSAAPIPYARVGEDGVNYYGPMLPNISRGPVCIVLFGLRAATLAQSSAMEAQLARTTAMGRPWKLIPIDSNQNWGVASTQLVQALSTQHPLAIIALDRKTAHLSEQMALKTFVPVLALSDDETLTAANIPWIFRLPSGTTPASALRLLEDTEKRGGPNPQRIRSVLASGQAIDGQAFLPTGDPFAR